MTQKRGLYRFAYTLFTLILLVLPVDKTNAQLRPCQIDKRSLGTVFFFSPNDKLLIANVNSYTLIAWDVATGSPIRSFAFDTNSYLTSADISADSHYLVAASQAGKMLLWDMNTGTQLQTFQHPTQNNVTVKFLPDSQNILSYASLDSDEEAILWDRTTGKKLHSFPSGGDPRNWLGFTQNYLMINYDDNSGPNVALWDINTGTLLKTFSPSAKAAISPDNKLVIVNRIDALIFWDIPKKSEVKTISLPFPASDDDAYEPEFSKDGNYFLLKGTNVAYLWDVRTASQQYVIDSHAEFLHDGNSIIAYHEPRGNDEPKAPTDLKLSILDIATGRVVRAISLPLSGPLFRYGWTLSSHNEYLALLNTDAGTIELWDTRTQKRVLTFSC